MSTAPGRSHFPSESGSGPDHPARRARTVAAVAAAGTVAALTGFLAVRAAQADGADSQVDTAAGTSTAGTGSQVDTAAGTGSAVDPDYGSVPDSGAGFDRGFDGDGDRPAPPDGGVGRGSFPGAPGQSGSGQRGPDQSTDGAGTSSASGPGAVPAFPGGGPSSSSQGS